MTVEFTLIETLSELQTLAEPWARLAREGGAGGLFRGPDWLLPWWQAYHRALGAELFVLAGKSEGELVCLAPFYRRTAGLAPIRLREIRLIGDAGPRPPALDLLCLPTYEEQAGVKLARTLLERAADWDVIDLEPLRDPSRFRAYLASHMSSHGHHVESNETGGARRIALSVAGIDPAKDAPEDKQATAYTKDDALLRKGLSALRRLSRLEWASREETSPLADAEAAKFLEDMVLSFGKSGTVRLARLDDHAGEAVAAALIVDDEDRAVVLAMSADPEISGAAERLLAAEAREASIRGRLAIDVVTGAVEHDIPSLPWSRQRAIQLKVFGHSRQATLARTYSAVNRRVQSAIGVPGAAASGARAAWSKIRTAAQQVAGYQRFHLYRGELWTRGVKVPPGLILRVFPETDFQAMAAAEREEMVELLQLDVEYCQRKWRRGDVAVLARVHDRPAGIAWAAFGTVYAPELEHSVALEPGDAYILDVIVAAMARGRAVAPSMLEFLANELRQRDLYRSWALIHSDNVASMRAFEKASYTAVCDVIYTRVASAHRLMVRPPDIEAKRILGLA